MWMIYHHLSDPTATATGCHQVLRQGGYVCVRSGTRGPIFRIGMSFRDCSCRLTRNCPSRQDMERVFAASSFAPLVHPIVAQINAPDWRATDRKSR
jgi:hypothetical protein